MTTTITIEAGAMTITMPEPERQAVIRQADAVFTDARTFALECVAILVKEHGARRGGISIDHFYHRRVGQQIAAVLDGARLETPQDMVNSALCMLWPWVLGLALATPERQAKIDAAWISIMGSTPEGEQSL
jgi:hypothetical protein